MRLGLGTTIRFSRIAGVVFIAGAVQLLTNDSAIAQVQPPCDFVTGGGFIVRDSGDKANFGVAGSCKNLFSWGHLEYVDHSYTPPLNVHWTSITAYLGPGCSPTGPFDPTTRCICGTATSNFGDVDFGVVVEDVDEPGVNDVFKIRLTQGGQVVYTTESDSDHTLGGSGSGGGNIQLHKPDPSSTFGGSCPAFPVCTPAGGACDQNAPNCCAGLVCNFPGTCGGPG
jgi:hypothetical protein